MDGKPTKFPKKNKKYDYAIIGSGMSSLSVGSLLAKAGKKVCILEAHDIPGGYAHNFKMGDFTFCAQIHYIWGCHPGDTVYEFLKKLNLHKDILFEQLDPDGYDHMVVPGHRLKIPSGYPKLIEHVVEQFPEDARGIKRFVRILEGIEEELRNLPKEEVTLSMILTRWYQFPWLLRYQKSTLQNAFDECKLSQNLQCLLAAQAGDYMLPPKELSMIAFVVLFGGYNRGAFYPKKHFKYFVERIAKTIEDAPGCDIFYETPVTEIKTEGDRVTGYVTKHGHTVVADQYICNMDPQAASYLIGRDKFPKKWLKPLSYKYSETGFMIYCGVKGLDLRKYGIGNYNIWHCEQNDMNKMWEEMRNDDFSNPWFFLESPTIHSKAPGIAPEGCDILQIEFFASYDNFKNVQNKDYNEYLRKKHAVAKQIIALVEKRYIPDLSKHIVMRVIGSPTTNEYWAKSPKGNAYGSQLTPENVSLGRLKSKTPFKNFYWCNASSGGAGVCGTVGTGMRLYEQLMGDVVLDTRTPEYLEKATLGRFFSVMLGRDIA